VLDPNNTSGFFPNATNGVVAIYTLNTAEAETQEVAYSSDNGYTFTKYANNPVLSANSTNFRDPKVFYYEPTSSWVMVVSFAADFVITIYTSPNLTSWTFASNITYPGLASTGAVSECPNLVLIPTLIDPNLPLSQNNTAPLSTWLLIVSLNPGAPLGGSISTYFPGLFNGTHFTQLTPSTTRLTDFCKDNYATQFYYDVEPPTSFAWASNWEYAQVTPVDTTSNLSMFRSYYSLPRTHALANLSNAGYDLLTFPPDLTSLYTTTSPLAQNANISNSSLYVAYAENVPSRAITFTINATNIPLNTSIRTGSLNFTLLSSTTGESIRGGFFLGGANPSVFFISRAQTYGFDPTNPFFTKDFSVSSPVVRQTSATEAMWSMQVIVDRGIVEVYLDGGRKVGTMIYFVNGELDTLIVSTEGVSDGTVAEVVVWGLESIWEEEGMGSMRMELR
jgi:beta-fructofuranosidase